MESRKMVLKNLFTIISCSSGETDIENRLMDMGRGEERVEMYRKSNMETYITICKIYSQREFSVWLRKLQQRLCINLEGWDDGELGNGTPLRTLAWKIPWTEDPGRLQSRGSLRVGHD